jgi:two-component system, response regulator
MIKVNEAEILLIGDDPLLHHCVKEVISQYTFQYRLWHAESGQRALNYIFSRGEFFTLGKRKAPRLVIVSSSISDMHAKIFTGSVKKNEITKAVPVIIVAAKKDEADKINFYRLGANSYLLKPAADNDFMTLIKKVMDYWLLLNQSAANIE